MWFRKEKRNDKQLVSFCRESGSVGVFPLQVRQINRDGTGTIPLNSGRGWGTPHMYFVFLNTKTKEHSVKQTNKKTKRKLIICTYTYN